DDNAVLLISGFTRADVMVFDVTDPRMPVYVQAPVVNLGNGSYGVTLAPPAPGTKYYALTSDAVLTPSWVRMTTQSTLKDIDHPSEYLIVTTDEFKDTAQKLADFHGELSSQVVDIEDVYDTFSYGISSPYALRSFLAYAHKNWTTAPRYVLLAGDGSYDYKNLTGQGDNLIPPMMVTTPQGLYPSDTWFADVAGGPAPEIAIGRLPAADVTELDQMIGKIQKREGALASEWANRLMLLADNADKAGAFPDDSNRIANMAPPSFPVEKVYLSHLGLDAARARLISGINNGTGLINYFGHAGYDVYADEGLLTNADIAAFVNDTTPVVMSTMTCVAGHFALPGYPSINELMVRKASGGAVAIWGPTGLSVNELAVPLSTSFYAKIFGGGEVRLGDAINAAMQDYEARGGPQYMLHIYALLGDPAMRVQ
ncbi:MAG: C25 family cysteine peptidase, partial [Vicinamibacteria bacterium]|nr:C25 family cysteine peptidase [Vicinamibacteria bacterium]